MMGVDRPTVAGPARHLIQAKAVFPAGESRNSEHSAGILGAILGTLISHEPTSQTKYNELLVRSNTGLGAEKATAH